MPILQILYKNFRFFLEPILSKPSTNTIRPPKSSPESTDTPTDRPQITMLSKAATALMILAAGSLAAPTGLNSSDPSDSTHVCMLAKRAMPQIDFTFTEQQK